ncbi:MAG: hypothetical protein WCQ45_04145, partial [bacterium]
PGTNETPGAKLPTLHSALLRAKDCGVTVASELASDVTMSATTFATIVSRHMNIAHKGGALSRHNRAH